MATTINLADAQVTLRLNDSQFAAAMAQVGERIRTSSAKVSTALDSSLKAKVDALKSQSKMLSDAAGKMDKIASTISKVLIAPAVVLVGLGLKTFLETTDGAAIRTKRAMLELRYSFAQFTAEVGAQINKALHLDEVFHNLAVTLNKISPATIRAVTVAVGALIAAVTTTKIVTFFIRWASELKSIYALLLGQAAAHAKNTAAIVAETAAQNALNASQKAGGAANVANVGAEGAAIGGLGRFATVGKAFTKVSAVLTAILVIFSTIGDGETITERTKSGISKAWDGVKSTLERLRPAIEVLSTAFSAIIGVIDSIVLVIDGLINTAETFMSQLVSQITNLFSGKGWLNRAEAIREEGGRELVSTWKRVFDGVKKSFEGAVPKAEDRKERQFGFRGTSTTSLTGLNQTMQSWYDQNSQLDVIRSNTDAQRNATTAINRLTDAVNARTNTVIVSNRDVLTDRAGVSATQSMR